MWNCEAGRRGMIFQGMVCPASDKLDPVQCNAYIQLTWIVQIERFPRHDFDQLR